MPTEVERRKFRRVNVGGISIIIQRLGDGVADSSKVGKEGLVGQVKNVSLSGAYCYIKGKRLDVSDQVNCSISIPQEQTKTVPFSRILGRGIVLRLEPITEQNTRRPSSDPIYGVTITFSADVTALGAANS